ncbi:hypothetical protein C7271_22495 [filamentous cyanobacterium CCP5]|nr:hypothetical protein C7271_22495 [filamentous cyanobacterium CCP5]
MTTYNLAPEIKKEIEEVVARLLKDERKHETEERQSLIDCLAHEAKSQLTQDRAISTGSRSVPLWLFVLLAIWSIGTSFFLGWNLSTRPAPELGSFAPASQIELQLPQSQLG